MLGHEVAGVVEEVGEGVERFKAGDRVVTTHHVPCMICRYCLTDRHASARRCAPRASTPAASAEFVRLPAVNVERGTFPVPDGVSFEEGSFVEPLACVVRALRLSRLAGGGQRGGARQRASRES